MYKQNVGNPLRQWYSVIKGNITGNNKYKFKKLCWAEYTNNKKDTVIFHLYEILQEAEVFCGDKK